MDRSRCISTVTVHFFPGKKNGRNERRNLKKRRNLVGTVVSFFLLGLLFNSFSKVPILYLQQVGNTWSTVPDNHSTRNQLPGSSDAPLYLYFRFLPEPLSNDIHLVF